MALQACIFSSGTLVCGSPKITSLVFSAKKHLFESRKALYICVFVFNVLMHN